MKKYLLVVLVTTLWPLFLVANTQLPLLPEVKAALEVPVLDEKEMANNSYIYLLTIEEAEANYFDIAKDYLIQENQQQRWFVSHYDQIESIKPIKLTYTGGLDLTIKGKPYVFLCKKTLKDAPVDDHCISDVLTNKQQFMALIKKNKNVLARYEQVVLRPNYYTYNYGQGSSTYPVLSDLEIFRAILAIDEGNVNKGLMLLQQELDFAKKIYASKTNIASKLAARTRLMRLYYTLSYLLKTDPVLRESANLVKVKALLSALPPADQLELEFAMRGERFDALIRAIELRNVAIKEAKRLHLAFSLNKTLNKIYLTFEPYITFTQLTLTEISQIYIKNESISHLQECIIRPNSMEGDCDKDNFWGIIMQALVEVSLLVSAIINYTMFIITEH